MLYYKELTGKILGALVEVHERLGPGHYEKTYQKASAHEFTLRGISFREQLPVRIKYKDIIAKELKLDFLVEDKVIVELKAKKEINNIEKAQMLAYLKATGKKVGLLVNFGKRRIQIKRFVL
ncbi:MAG: GxxExxY protein [bacterium (Candidatus Stahlbacteria) CG23_combo_of_CG06-09_8_20_14_all_40_9]|nr:MAG: GxxExxY protein [bacterium (Candidatus Stahlbacteria) CG23_combo_of_CG06-09_8_20_14_all_40_9]